MTVALPSVDATAKRAVELLQTAQPHVSVVGRDGSGKSSVLGAIEPALRADGWQVFRVAFPRVGDDASIVALLELAAQLDAGLLDDLRSPSQSWDKKQALVLDALEARGAGGARAALLIDDPVSTQEPNATRSVFQQHAVSLSGALASLRKVSTVEATRFATRASSLRLEPASVPAQILGSQHWSGELRDAACALQAVPRLARYSPLELRLLVGMVSRGLAVAELGGGRWDPRVIVARLFDPSMSHKLRALLAALALVRTPFDGQLLTRLGADGLDAQSRRLLDEALLIREPSGDLRLHDLVAREAREWQWAGPSETDELRAELARWHDQQFQTAAQALNSGAAIRHETEVIYQLTEAGDADAVLGRSLAFVEQLDALGKALSLRKRHRASVSVYERALAHDPDDAYAHHYLAWNLDVQPAEPDRILTHYTRALELEPGRVWYHGRRICFLLTIGRLDEAMESWTDACAELDVTDPVVATELHRRVAQLLLHRGQLEPARQVLGDVPPRLRAELEWYPSLRLLLEEQEEAEHQRFVFPPTVARDRRWDAGPHLLRDAADRPRVVRWLAGRITAVDHRGTHLRIAERDAGGAERFGYRTIGRDELHRVARYASDGLSLPVGTFVELITLRAANGESESDILLSWPREPRRLAGLTDIFPRPDRFIRRATAGL